MSSLPADCWTAWIKHLQCSVSREEETKDKRMYLLKTEPLDTALSHIGKENIFFQRKKLLLVTMRSSGQWIWRKGGRA